MEPACGRNFISWMMEEIGESIAVIKKKGDAAIMDDPSVRDAFVEEMSDVLMYFTDTLLRYNVTPEELSAAYVNKHERNMGRNYQGEYSGSTRRRDKIEV
jgi:NTP pyrophosphatase (non-canonical NTP hydrolase)